MSRVVDEFQKAIHKQMGRLPVWLPGSDMAIGDVGTLQDGRWTPVSSLEELHIPYSIHQDESKLSAIEISSTDGVTVTARTNVDSHLPNLPGVPSGKAGIGLKFAHEGAFAFSAYGCLTHTVRGLASIESEILARIGPESRKPAWEFDWVLVSEIFVADRALVAVSGSSSGEISIDLDVDLGAPNATLGKAGAGTAIAHNSAMAAAQFTVDPTVLLFGGRQAYGGVFTPTHIGDAGRRLQAFLQEAAAGDLNGVGSRPALGLENDDGAMVTFSVPSLLDPDEEE